MLLGYLFQQTSPHCHSLSKQCKVIKLQQIYALCELKQEPNENRWDKNKLLRELEKDVMHTE